MKWRTRLALLTPVAVLCTAVAMAQADPRLREVVYDPHAVITVPVKRGAVTHVVLDADEAISEVGAGLGADCTKPEAAWCIAAQPGGPAKPGEPTKAGASEPALVATQTFVTLGPTRGDQVAVVKGIQEGDTVVTSGQMKLRPGTPLIVNNSVVPRNDPKPRPQEQ